MSAYLSLSTSTQLSLFTFSVGIFYNQGISKQICKAQHRQTDSQTFNGQSSHVEKRLGILFQALVGGNFQRFSTLCNEQIASPETDIFICCSKHLSKSHNCSFLYLFSLGFSSVSSSISFCTKSTLVQLPKL